MSRNFASVSGLVLASIVLAACGGGGGSSSPGLAAPSALSVTLLSHTVSVTDFSLSWTDNSNDETAFKIERGTDGITFSPLVTVGANVQGYIEGGLTPLTKYYYRVRASNASGDSAPSNTVSVTTPPPVGSTYFSSPYSADGSAAPIPATLVIAKSAAISKLDVGIVVDTTGSMGGTIANLKSGLASMFSALQAIVPDLAVGIAGQDDFPYAPYGAAGTDLPFYVASSPSGFVTTDAATAQIAANILTTHSGGDGPEAQAPAMQHALSGAALAWPTGSLSAATPPAGTFGGLHFRSAALPILVNLSDVDFHNGKRALDTTGSLYDTALQNVYSFSTVTIDDLVTSLNTLGAKFIGGAADGGARSVAALAPYGPMAYLADKNLSLAPPSAFTHTASCPAGQCCTGLAGAGVLPDGPTIGGVQQCRMVFSYPTAGTGVGSGLVAAVQATVNSLQFDVYPQLYNDAAEVIDMVDSLVQKVEPVPAGGTDPATGTACATFSPTLLSDRFSGPKALPGAGDIQETINQVGGPARQYCYRLTLKANTSIPSTVGTQVHKIWLRLQAIKPTGGTYILGADVPIYIIVP